MHNLPYFIVYTNISLINVIKENITKFTLIAIIIGFNYYPNACKNAGNGWLITDSMNVLSRAFKHSSNKFSNTYLQINKENERIPFFFGSLNSGSVFIAIMSNRTTAWDDDRWFYPIDDYQCPNTAIGRAYSTFIDTIRS